MILKNMKVKRPTTIEEARNEAIKIAKVQIKKYPQLKGNIMIPLIWYLENKKEL